MDYRRPVRLAVSFIAIAIFAQDASDLLEKARDKLLPALPSGPKYVCDETIDRSYFSHNHSSLFRPSCEQLSIDRKKGGRRRLDATDRLRVAVTVAQDREIYSWPGPGVFSRSVEEILRWGPIDTGAFSMYLTDIFTNPSVRFRIIDEPGTALEYGFRVPLEGSHLVVRGGAEWRPAGYDGTVSIDRSFLGDKTLHGGVGRTAARNLDMRNGRHR
jgi:hypothetical protein